ncbi:MAG: hypothetical protein JJ934_13040 [Pseudomonadales bacterium]|nr:hypothetical protein [Pseudomonadales bacterium]
MVDDHWPIPFLDGELRLLSKKSLVDGVEVILPNQPTQLAPRIKETPNLPTKASIIGHDVRIEEVRERLQAAITFVSCYFDVEIPNDDLEVEFIPEREEEKVDIKLREMKFTRSPKPLQMSFDILTRAIMASGKMAPPHFVATLVSAARDRYLQDQYIDSFRYSFLLIEAIYGEGKFKSKQLTAALCESPELVRIVSQTLAEPLTGESLSESDTSNLLSASASPQQVIKHLVEKRGYYFHGNLIHSDPWEPQEQGRAESLALLALQIASQIASDSAKPMFAEEFNERHFNDAKRIGATLSMEVNFTYKEPGENLDRKASVKITVPGTKITSKNSRYVARQFLDIFERETPTAHLKSAYCKLLDTNEPVFEMKFHDKSEQI